MATESISGSNRPKMPLMTKFKIAAGVGAVTVFAFHAVPHIFPNLNRKMFEMKPGQELTEEHRAIFLSTCRDMDVKNPENIKLFYNSGFTTLSAGSCELPNKAVIGLPRSFLLKDSETLRKSGVKFENKLVDWDSKVGKALEKALIPKDDQIAFTMAHEIAHIKNNDFMLRGLLSAGWLYTSCRLMMFIVPRAQGAPTVGRKVLLVFLLSCISLYGFSETDKYVRCKLEFRADSTAAKSGILYKNGGINYMKSRLRVNRVLRHLTGVTGVQRYTPKGDDLHDTGHPFITERIERLKDVRV